MTPREAAALFQAAADGLEAALVRAVEKTQEAALEAADEFSSGTLSYADLRREDHPYARRHGAPLRDPGLVNEHSGRFRRDWRGLPVTTNGDEVSAGIDNASPEAPYLEQLDGGPNSSMFARPITAKIEERVAPMLEQNVQAALASLLPQ